jgi:hypothetical protein
MDKIFGKYLIRITVVAGSGLGGEKWEGHWKIFDTELTENVEPIATGVAHPQASFDTASTFANAEAVLWLEQQAGRGKVEAYRDD